MPKLPSDFVKAPTFDNPLRSTTGKVALAERKLVLRLDEPTWDALWAASERVGSSPEAVIKRALDRFLNEPESVAMAPKAATDPALRPSIRGQVIERLQERVARLTWFQRLMTLRSILREGRA
jgi:hypothetical protein